MAWLAGTFELPAGSPQIPEENERAARWEQAARSTETARQGWERNGCGGQSRAITQDAPEFHSFPDRIHRGRKTSSGAEAVMAGVGSHTGGRASRPRCASAAVSDAAPLIFD